MMNCTDINTQLDAYIQGELTDQEQQVVDRHIAACTYCQQQLNDERTMYRMLKQLPVEQASAGFEDRVFQAVRQQYPQHQRHGFKTGFATAIAASLAIWFASTVFIPTAEIETQMESQEISLAVNDPQTVRLLFDAAADLDQVRLSIDLPANVELSGYPGQRALSWQTSLKKGQNVLALPVMAIDKGRGELVAELDYGDKHKTYRLILKTTKDGVVNYQVETVKSV